ncbi:hypothetical protein I2I11_19880 [Pontibacter sp. 172403-2]|nr:hypothetical protein [Pontibacter sp. 172403-2]
MIKEKPTFTIKFLIILLVSTIIIRTIEMIFEKEIGAYLILFPSNLSQPLHWYRFFTYPLESVGLFGWFRIALIILPAGYIIEKRTNNNILVTIILISALLGGLLFTIINYGNELNRPIASAGLIAWGFWIATICCGILQWKDLNIIEKVIILLFLLNIFSFNHSDFGYLVAQICVVVTILAFILTFKIFKRKALANTV